MDLRTTSLLNCQGTITHTLTLLISGTVRIRYSTGVEVDVEPATGRVLVPGFTVSDTVLQAARSLALGR